MQNFKLDATIQRVEKEKLVKETEKKIADIDLTASWREDFNDIKTKRPDLLQRFQELVGVMYRGGEILYAYQVEGSLNNPTEVLAFAGANKLVEREKKEDGSTMMWLTEKGKYFSRLLMNEGVNVK